MIIIKIICGVTLLAMGVRALVKSVDFDIKYWGLIPKIDFIDLFLAVLLFICSVQAFRM